MSAPRTYWLRSCYFEQKLIKRHRYWYLRFSDGGKMRSVYLGKVKPSISAPQAYDEYRKFQERTFRAFAAKKLGRGKSSADAGERR